MLGLDTRLGYDCQSRVWIIKSDMINSLLEDTAAGV